MLHLCGHRNATVETRPPEQLVRTGSLFSPCGSKHRTRAIRLGDKQSWPLSYLDYECSYSLLFIFLQHFTYSPFTVSLGLSVVTGESLQEAWSLVLPIFNLLRLSVYFQWGLESFHIQDHYGMGIFTVSIVSICSYFIYHLLNIFFMIFLCNYLDFLSVGFWFIDLQLLCYTWFKIFYSFEILLNFEQCLLYYFVLHLILLLIFILKSKIHIIKSASL